MPLIQESKPTPVEPPIKPTEPTRRHGERQDGTYRGAVVNTRHEAVQSLLTYSEGSKWTVDYFRQLLGQDDEVATHQQDQLTVYQQYELISSYPLRVTESLSGDQDDSNGNFNVTGQAVIPVAIIPNAGDMFIADIGDGRQGIFTIERVVRKSILQDAVYQINYRLMGYATGERLADLNEKVVRELTYSDDHLDAVDGPLIATEELTRYHTLQKVVGQLSEVWHNRFLDPQTNAYLRPTEKKCYDPYLSQAMQSVLDMGNESATVFADFHNDPVVDSATVWKWLVAGEKIMTFNLVKRNITCGTTRWQRELLYSGVTMTDIAEIVYPDRSIKVEEEDTVELSEMGHYVFSRAFYDEDTVQCSDLERLVWDYLNHKVLDSAKLLSLFDSASDWSDLEFFYHVPVLIILIRGYLRRQQ